MALITATLLLAGCATPQVPYDTAHGPLVSGRFGLKASFLPEPAQGRFEWRWRGDQDHEVWIQDPWGQVQGVFLRSAARPGPWAGWSLTDARGRPISPDSRSGGPEVAGLTPETLHALAEMLDTLGERLRPNAHAAAEESDPAFSLRRAQAAYWIELRIARDRAPSPAPPAPPPCQRPAPC